MSLTTNIRVHARQLALQPHLQILRRSRRPLLCGMEQARRPALAHHVHRTAPMGPRVLINGIWYKGLFALSATGTGLSRFRTMPGIRRRSSTLSALAPTAVQTIAPPHAPFGGF